MVRYLFTSLKFEYGGMSKKPTSYHYEKAKDIIKWNKLKPKKYISLLDSMFYKFVQMLPS